MIFPRLSSEESKALFISVTLNLVVFTLLSYVMNNYIKYRAITIVMTPYPEITISPLAIRNSAQPNSPHQVPSFKPQEKGDSRLEFETQSLSQKMVGPEANARRPERRDEMPRPISLRRSVADSLDELFIQYPDMGKYMITQITGTAYSERDSLTNALNQELHHYVLQEKRSAIEIEAYRNYYLYGQYVNPRDFGSVRINLNALAEFFSNAFKQR